MPRRAMPIAAHPPARSAAEALDCTVLDHLVFAGAECTSLRAMGLL